MGKERQGWDFRPGDLTNEKMYRLFDIYLVGT